MSRFKGLTPNEIIQPWYDYENYCFIPGTPQDIIDMWEEVMRKDCDPNKIAELPLSCLPLD